MQTVNYQHAMEVFNHHKKVLSKKKVSVCSNEMFLNRENNNKVPNNMLAMIMK